MAKGTVKAAWIAWSFFFLFWVALMGTSMRLFAAIPQLQPFEHLLHSHSHVGFQGWLYTLIFVILVRLYVRPEEQRKGRYALQFWLTLSTLFGILLAFFFQGYGFYSILFSSVFQVLSYVFFYRFIRDTKQHPKFEETRVSLAWIRAGIGFNVLSTFGPWVLGILSAQGMAHSEWYDAAIYFFLHFQYNGWFTFIAVGLLFYVLGPDQHMVRKAAIRITLFVAVIATLLSYGLSLLGMQFRPFVYWPAVAGSLGLFAVLITVFYQFSGSVSVWLRDQKWVVRMSFRLVFIFIVVKVLMQLLSTLPALESFVFGQRNLIMFYMHWTLIGCISLFFISFVVATGMIAFQKRLHESALFLFLIGFLVTEGLLLFSSFGFTPPNFVYLMGVFSSLMLVGTLIWLLGAVRQR